MYDYDPYDVTRLNPAVQTDEQHEIPTSPIRPVEEAQQDTRQHHPHILEYFDEPAADVTRLNPSLSYQSGIRQSPARRATLVQMHRVSKSYMGPMGAVPIFTDIHLTISTGEFIAVTGPSGSGKSTLINMITGIDRPTRGQVLIEDRALHDLDEDQQSRFRGRKIGVIFQFFQLLPTLSAVENVMMPMTLCNTWKARERRRRALHLLSVVGMAAHADKFPSMLSGGQQQRVAIARALANDPPLLIGDEPTGNLDRESAEIVFTLFTNLVRQGKTVMIVTHDMALAKRIPRVIEVQDGRVCERRISAWT